MTRKKKTSDFVFFCITSVFSLFCFVSLPLIRSWIETSLHVTWTRWAIHLSLLPVCTYSIYYCNCNTKMGCAAMNPKPPPRTHVHFENSVPPPPHGTHPWSAHRASSKKGLASFLSVSWNRQTFQLQRWRSEGTGQMDKKDPSNMNERHELDLATTTKRKEKRADLKRECPHRNLISCQSAKWESLLANWDINACRLQAGLLCAWKRCLISEQPGLEHSWNKEMAVM